MLLCKNFRAHVKDVVWQFCMVLYLHTQGEVRRFGTVMCTVNI